MFEIFMEEKGITALMFGLFGFSILAQLLLGFLYGRMIRETENMAVTQNVFLRQCKLKFTQCHQLNNGVHNVPIFVDKFLGRMTLGPFTYDGLYHFSGQTMLLSVVMGGIGICKSISEGKMLGQVIPFYVACFAELYLYVSISSAVDVKEKKRMLKVNLVDYLDNHLSSRIGTTREDLEMLHYVKPGKKTIEFMPIGKQIEVRPAQEGEEGEERAARQEMDWSPTAEELEALLKEFLAI